MMQEVLVFHLGRVVGGLGAAVAVAVVGVAGAGVGAAGAAPLALPPIPGLPTLPDLPNILPPLPALPPIPGLPTPAPRVDLEKSFAALTENITATTPGRLGVAIAAPGSGAPVFFGTVGTARAWSTLKAPVAVAAERAHVEDLQPMEAKSIRDSDNDSAEAIWDSLGDTRHAVDAVSAVLRDGGDSRTRVASALSRPVSFPGATQWATTDQAVFAANLPCLTGADAVVANMGQVGANQRWGLAEGKKGVGTAVKGGWGPVSDTTGKYVVRQLAVVTTGRGTVGVSLVAIPTSGSLTDGAAMLTRAGDWVQRNLPQLPAGRCAPTIPGSVR